MPPPTSGRDDLSRAASARAEAPAGPWIELAGLAAVTAAAALLRGVGVAGLPPDLGEAAHFLTANPDRFLSPRAWSAALGAASPAIAWALLRRGAGPCVALAAAAIAATTPFAVHVSRSGSTVGATFVASLALFAALRGLRPLPAAGAGLAMAALACLSASKAVATSAAIETSAWFSADLGLGSLVFVAAAWFAPPRAGAGAISPRRRATLVLAAGAALSTALALAFAPGPAAASLCAAVVVLAGSGLGRWWESAPTPLARLAALVFAIVPSFPSLASEFVDGGRFDVAPLAAAFAELRRGGEPLYASDPAFASHGFGVECLQLPVNARTPEDFLPADRTAWVLLLFDGGRPLGDHEGVTPAIERGLALVARSTQKRFDLHRYEARLYRREAPARERRGP
jgi:hypothetical protein